MKNLFMLEHLLLQQLLTIYNQGSSSEALLKGEVKLQVDWV
jgi:hypothetical protein